MLVSETKVTQSAQKSCWSTPSYPAQGPSRDDDRLINSWRPGLPLPPDPAAMLTDAAPPHMWILFPTPRRRVSLHLGHPGVSLYVGA